MVKSRDLRFFETLDNREDRSVDEAERQVAITIQKLSDPSIVIELEVDDSQDAGVNVGEETQKRVWVQTLTG